MNYQAGKIDFITGLFLVLFTMWAVMYIGDAIESSSTAERDKTMLEYKKEMVSEMTEILVELEALNDPAVSQFVDDWQKYYKDVEVKPSILAELKIIQQKINTDPSSARKFTSEHKNKAIKDVNAIASPVFGFAPDANMKPGL